MQLQFYLDIQWKLSILLDMIDTRNLQVFQINVTAEGRQPSGLLSSHQLLKAWESFSLLWKWYRDMSTGVRGRAAKSWKALMTPCSFSHLLHLGFFPLPTYHLDLDSQFSSAVCLSNSSSLRPTPPPTITTKNWLKRFVMLMHKVFGQY